MISPTANIIDAGDVLFIGAGLAGLGEGEVRAAEDSEGALTLHPAPDGASSLAPPVKEQEIVTTRSVEIIVERNIA